MDTTQQPFQTAMLRLCRINWNGKITAFIIYFYCDIYSPYNFKFKKIILFKYYCIIDSILSYF